ncbi:hypothetical protein NDN08_008306 [Rhodosorus marinus]|uniref:Uncharacterized protein n=1 Tax=Rhodosorus marinus TaxID=101924 RepID=A0AAV8V1S4_9RHOD|nr:hypothetical protein NDN08_008306 [Rhodosorus marinus]
MERGVLRNVRRARKRDDGHSSVVEEGPDPLDARTRPRSLLEVNSSDERLAFRKIASEEEEASVGKRNEGARQPGRLRLGGGRKEERHNDDSNRISLDETEHQPSKRKPNSSAWKPFVRSKSILDGDAEDSRRRLVFDSQLEHRPSRAAQGSEPRENPLDRFWQQEMLDAHESKAYENQDGTDSSEDRDSYLAEDSMVKQQSAVRLFGTYADPGEEIDDWGDDFDLDELVPSTEDLSMSQDAGWSTHEEKEIDEPIKPSDVPSCQRLLKSLEDPSLSAELDRGMSWLSRIMSSSEIELAQKKKSLLFDEDVEKAENDFQQVLEWKTQLAVVANNYFELGVSLLKKSRVYRSMNRFADASQVLDRAADALQRLEDSPLSATDSMQKEQLELEILAEEGELALELGANERGRRILSSALEKGEGAVFAGSMDWCLMSMRLILAKASFSGNDLVAAADAFATYALDSMQWVLKSYAMFGARTGVNPPSSLFQSMLDSMLVLPDSTWQAGTHDLVPNFVPSGLAESFIFLTDCFVTFGEHSNALSIAKFSSFIAHEFDLVELATKAARDCEDIDDLLARDEEDGGIDSDIEEDWDNLLETELNVKIIRCSEQPSAFKPIFGASGDEDDNGSWRGSRDDLSTRLVQTEARRFIENMFAEAASSNKTMLQLFPLPTRPYQTDKGRNTRELESWIRSFVRKHTRVMRLDMTRGTKRSADFHLAEMEPEYVSYSPLTVEISDPMSYFRAIIPYVEKFSADWSFIHMHTCWRLLRCVRNVMDGRRLQLRLLLHEYFSELASFFKRIPIFDEQERQERFRIFWYNLQMCGMARELLTPDGIEARGYLQLLDYTRKSVPRDPKGNDESEVQAAKLAVDLHVVDTTAHYGRSAMTPEEWESALRSGRSVTSNTIQSYMAITKSAGKIWRKWRKFDRKKPSMVVIEELSPEVMYAQTLCNLYLVIVGLSPLDLTELRGEKQNGNRRPDTTSEVEIHALHEELEKLYPKLPETFTKAKLAFSLAYHAANIAHEHSFAERLLYDSLTLLQTYSTSTSGAVRESIDIGVFMENVLQRYGAVLLHNEKYRYSIAAFEAAMDARLVGEAERSLSFSSAAEVANVSLKKGDWRHALRLLYPLRGHLHPKDGNRNEFSRYCLTLSSICFDAGCFDAATEPLRAYSMLLVEEHFLNLSRLKFLSAVADRHGKGSLPQAGVDAVGALGSIFGAEVQQELSDYHHRLNIERSQLDVLHVKNLLARGHFQEAEEALQDLLTREIPFGKKAELLQLRAGLKFRRGEISRCLEFLQLVEREHREMLRCRQRQELSASEERADGRSPCAASADPCAKNVFNPDVAFLRIRALLCGERFNEALDYIENLLPLAKASNMKNQGKLHYLRAKVLHALQYYQTGDRASATALALQELDTAESIYRRIGDDLLVAKVNLLHLKVALEWIFCAMEIRQSSFTGAMLVNAKRTLDADDLEHRLMALLVFFKRVNTPLELADALLCLAEFRLLETKKTSSWAPWLKLSWELIAHLLLDKFMHLVTERVCSVSYLLKLKKIFERMVRLVLFDERGTETSTHVRIFEAYLRIERDVKKRMNVSKAYIEKKKKKKKSQKKQLFSDAQSTNVLQSLGYSGVDELAKGYKLVSESVVGTGNVVALALPFKLPLPRFLRVNGAPEATDEELSLGIGAVKVLNNQRTAFGRLMRHISANFHDVMEIYEPRATDADKVLSSMFQMKVTCRKFCRGEITLEEMSTRNSATLKAWMKVGPRGANSLMNIPDHIWHHLFYILRANRLVGYYSVESGKCVRKFPFGGFEPNSEQSALVRSSSLERTNPRAPTRKEYQYISELVQGADSNGDISLKERELFQGLARKVFCAPQQLFNWKTPATLSKGRPAILMVSESFLSIPWELFFDHLVVRSLCLMDLVRGIQTGGHIEALKPSARTVERIKYLSFYTERKSNSRDMTDLSRRKLLSQQALLKIGYSPPDVLVKSLGIKGFNEPRLLDAIERPRGPCNSPLAVARIKRWDPRNIAAFKSSQYPYVDFVKVPWLSSATAKDLEEAASKREKAAVYVFLFTFADLVDSSEAVFDLYKQMGNSILLLTSAPKMDVLARHLTDWEVDRKWLFRAQGTKSLHETLKLLLQNISIFCRERQIPIVQFVGEDLIEPIMRTIAKESAVNRMRRGFQL